MAEFNQMKAADAQKEYQERTGSPAFSPRFGSCWSCRRNIYELHYWKRENGMRSKGSESDHTHKTGISVEKARAELVTGCPHCNRSYCD